MKSWLTFLTFVSSVALKVSALDIIGMEVLEGIGEDEDNPIHTGEYFTLQTTLETDDDEWFSCTWVHRVNDVGCTRALEDNTLICPEHEGARSCGGTVDPCYANRVTVLGSSTFPRACTLFVNKADHRDSGKWENFVSAASPSGIDSLKITLDIYVVNQTATLT